MLLGTGFGFIELNQKKKPNNVTFPTPSFGSMLSFQAPENNKFSFVAPFALKTNNHSSLFKKEDIESSKPIIQSNNNQTLKKMTQDKGNPFPKNQFEIK